GRKGLARAGVKPDLSPRFIPVAGGIDGSIGGEDGSVQLLVGEFEPGGALVIEVGEGALFEAWVLRGFGHDGRAPDQQTGLGWSARDVTGAGKVDVVDADHEGALGLEAVAGLASADRDGSELVDAVGDQLLRGLVEGNRRTEG